MSFKFFLLSIPLFSAQAILPKIRNERKLSPTQIGLYHTDAFKRLGDAIELQNPIIAIKMIQNVLMM